MSHSFARTDPEAHDLLSEHHGDTSAANPQHGDMIVASAETAGATDADAYWLNGLPLDGIAGEVSLGGEDYWLNGKPSTNLIAGTTLSDVLWRRQAIGSEGQVQVVTGGLPVWTDLPSLTIGQGAFIYRSSNFTSGWGVETTVSFDTVTRDDAGYFSSATPTRFTVSRAGWYHFTGTCTVNYAHFALFWIMIYVNGVLRLSHQGGGTNTTAGWGGLYEPRQVTGLLYLSAGDYIELRTVVSRTSGASAVLIGGTAFTNFSIIKVG